MLEESLEEFKKKSYEIHVLLRNFWRYSVTFENFEKISKTANRIHHPQHGNTRAFTTSAELVLPNLVS